MWENLSAIFSVVMTILMMLLVFVLVYFATKAIGRRAGGQTAGGGNIRVIDRAYLGQDRMLVIVEAAGETMLLGVTPHHIERLCDIDAENLLQQPETAPGAVFSETFKNVLQQNLGIGKKGRSDDE